MSKRSISNTDDEYDIESVKVLKLGKPIAPDQIPELKKKAIPHEVYDVFNFLIGRNFKNGRAEVYQKDVVKELEKLKDLDFKYWMLNIEEAYENEGWEVFYDKPAYCEQYEPSFTFKKKEQNK